MEVKYCDFGLAVGCQQAEPMRTLYVVTRYYRAPELCAQYVHSSFPVDVWALGCILAELLGRRILFTGDSYITQLQHIFYILGFPSDLNDLKGSQSFVQYSVKHWGGYKGKPMRELFPRASEEILDLLKDMLHINPDKRLTVDQAIEHPCFKMLREMEDETICDSRFLFKLPDNTSQSAIHGMLKQEVIDYYYHKK